ncbi:cis-prenyltransferase [Nowakowskiella sp. JEL0407]|nr:cis-prenyltransferase [Nowakowskiella sp. JEL0407]
MDGNRRFAKKQNLEIFKGHLQGFVAFEKTLEWCYELGVKCVTVYAFSIENFKRSKEEVEVLMDLFAKKLNEFVENRELVEKYGIRIRVVGDTGLLPEFLRNVIGNVEEMTRGNSGTILNVCCPYTARHEITSAVECVLKDTQSQKLKVNEITQTVIEDRLFTSDCPKLEILVRTSGEVRLKITLSASVKYSHKMKLRTHILILWPLAISAGNSLLLQQENNKPANTVPSPLSSPSAQPNSKSSIPIQLSRKLVFMDMFENQYTVKFSDAYISETSLQKSNYEIMVWNSNQYACKFPAHPSNTPHHPTTLSDEEFLLDSALNEINSLSGICLESTPGFWTYEYCHGKHVRQYRKTRKPSTKQNPHKSSSSSSSSSSDSDNKFFDKNTDNVKDLSQIEKLFLNVNYYLGYFPGDLGDFSRLEVGGLDVEVSKRDPFVDYSRRVGKFGSQMVVLDREGRQYLRQYWTDGTLCDKTTYGRTVEIQYHCCEESETPHISTVKEVSVCQYVVTIHLPQLCNLKPFTPGGGSSVPDESGIICKKIKSSSSSSTNGSGENVGDEDTDMDVKVFASDLLHAKCVDVDNCDAFEFDYDEYEEVAGSISVGVSDGEETVVVQVEKINVVAEETENAVESHNKALEAALKVLNDGHEAVLRDIRDQIAGLD